MTQEIGRIISDRLLPQPAETSPAPEATDLLSIKRKYALTYLLTQTGPLARFQVEDFAYAHYDDIEQGVQRSIKDVAESVGLAIHNPKDRFLSNYGLQYDRSEMEVGYSPTHKEGNRMPQSPIDSRAGDGPARPIIKELYSVAAFGEVQIATDRSGLETFSATTRGEKHADVLRVLILHAPLPDNGIVVLGRSSSFVQSK